MGVDWTALEEALRVSALRHAAEIVEQHPNHDFYAIALHGVSTEESETIDMPLLAMNSLQTLERNRLDENREQLVLRGEDPEEAEFYEDRPDADEYHETLDNDFLDDEDEDSDAENEDDAEDVDSVLQELEVGLEEDDNESFYSDKWEPSDWHWSSIELVEDVAAQLWSDALTSLAARQGWNETIRAYYRTMVKVAVSVRDALDERTKVDLVGYVADEEHAETLLKLCLSPQQLTEHFPEIAQENSLSETS